VTVASLEGLQDSSASLSRLRLPGTKTQLTVKLPLVGFKYQRGCGSGAYGMVLPVFRVTFLPRDMFAT
jgi:hypothetical protein